MLKIVVPAWEDWDPVKEKFIQGPQTVLFLEHSLLSISKWESKYHRPYIDKKQKTTEEELDYVKFMTLGDSKQNIKDEVYSHLTEENIQAIANYIGDPMTATTFSNRQQKRVRREIVTSELVYYWMTSLNIPFECQKWHFNRLMVLIHIASIKNQPPKKMGKKEQAAQTRSLNAARRARHNSRG